MYVHVPFCERVCPYCDFAVVARREVDAAEEAWLVEALALELRARADRYPGHRLATIYFGGGTPSLLRPEAIGQLIGTIRGLFPGDPQEVTLEVNPSTLERERLPGFRAAGVDRLSVGVQSFEDATLHRLGRAHRAGEAHATLAAAREAGFDNLSLDLIFAVPGQTQSQVQRDVEQTVAFAPEHVSAYALTVESGTPLATAVERGQWVLPDDDASAAMMTALADTLEAAGLARYETSSYARPGREARHNRRYWLRAPVLGVGVGAHSSEAPGPQAPFGARCSNERELAAWRQRIQQGDPAKPPLVERLDARAARAEAGFLALRTREGLAAAAFEREFGLSPEACWPDLRRLEREGLLRHADDRWQLTERGWLLSDSVFEHLV